MTSKELITQLYVGYFDRAPDPAGLAFWINVLDSGALTLTEIAQDFAGQPEAKATYSFLNNDPAVNVVADVEGFIEAIYENLFDRAPEPAGLTFWTNVLQNGFPVGTFIQAIIEGAATADAEVLAHKVEVACAWSDAAAAEDGFVLTQAYIDGSGAALGDVSADPATVEAGKDAAALFFQEAPTVVLENAIATLDEDADTSARTKVADIVVTDDGVGTNVLALTGDDAALFEIDGTELFLKAGAALDFETNASLDVTVTVDDAGIGASPDDSAALTIAVTDVDEPPTVTLENAISNISEAADTSAAVKVADIVVTDDATGSANLALTGADAALFEIVGTELVLKAGTALDFETNATLDVTVTVDDPALGGSPDDSAALALPVLDDNEPPSVSLANTLATLPENTDTSAALKVADIVITDDALGSNSLTVTGADAALFQIIGTELFLRAGAALDFETNPTLDVGVSVDDPLTGGTPDDSDAMAITVTDVNEAPSLTLTPVVSTLAENADTSAALKVADVTVNDDGQGANTLVLTGADAGLFQLIGTELFLKAGTALDFETNPSLNVTVTVDDPELDGMPDDAAPLSIAVTDVNEAPSVSLINTADFLLESADTSARIKMGDIVLADDALGTNLLSLSGADAALFEIDGTELFLKAGVVLDADSNPTLDVTVEVDDPAIGNSPDSIANLSLPVTDVNGAPTVALANLAASLDENTDTSARVKVADIVVTDDVAGSNTLSLAGADVALFEIDGTELFLKAGTVLDFETDNSLSISVEVDDPTLGVGVDDTADAVIAITDVNEAPMVSLAAITTALAEDTSVLSRIKMADIVVTDDALGTNTLALTGADAASFLIDGNGLYLRAGTSLDFETKPTFNVSVTVDDAEVGATPDSSAAFALNVTNVNETPALTLLNTETALFEGTNTSSRVQVATIQLNDDGTGTNTLALTGADAGLFEIVGTGLFLKAGTVLDADVNPSLDVSVTVDDATLPGSPDDAEALSIAISPGAPGAVANNTQSLILTGNVGSTVRFGQINVPDADPDTPGDQPGFILNTNPDGIPYAGVAGDSLSILDTTGHDGLVSLGVIARIDGTGLNADNEGFLLDNSGSTGDVTACLGEGDIFGVIEAPELAANGEWTFDNTGATGTMEITLKDLVLNAGGLLNFLNVDIVIDGAIDLTVLGSDLFIDGASTIEVAEGGVLTLTVEQVDDLEDAGLVIFGEGSVVVTGESGEDGTAATDDIDTNFGILQTATVDLSAVTLAASDSDDAVGITVSGATSDDAGTDLVVDGQRVAQTIIGTAQNDAVMVASSATDADTGTLDVILRLGADAGDIGDPIDTPEGTPDPTEMTGDTIDLDSSFANVRIEADAGFDAVVGTGFSNRIEVEVATGAEFYAPVVASDYTATASSSNDGTAVLEAVGLLDRDIDVSLVGGSEGWILIGGAGVTESQLVGGSEGDILVDGQPDDDDNNTEEDSHTGNDGADTFRFGVVTSQTATFDIATIVEAIDRAEITVDTAFADNAIVRFTFDIGSQTFNITLQDDVDGVDLETTDGVADALASELNGLNGISATAVGDVVEVENSTDGNSLAPNDQDNGARFNFTGAVEDPNGAANNVLANFTIDELEDADFSSDPDAGDDDRIEMTITLSGSVVAGEIYTIEITPDVGSPSTINVAAPSTSLQDLADAIASNIDAAFSNVNVGASSIGGGDALPGAGANELQTATSNAGIPANTVVLWNDVAGGDVVAFEVTAIGSTSVVSALSSSSLLDGSETTLAAADADVITDFVSGEDMIDFDLLPAGAGTYGEGAQEADFGDALAAATSNMTDHDNVYFLTSTAADGGLLFYDVNGDGEADGVLNLTGIDAGSFGPNDIV